MYKDFYGMSHNPFTRNVPPERLYDCPIINDVLGRLSYIADRQLFAVLTADPGCGKSTVLRWFVSTLDPEEYVVLYLSDSKLTPRWFYKGMLDQLGIESRFYRGDSRRQLHNEIEILREAKHKKVVCILDEAHLLERETLEEFRFLLNFQFDSMSPMALVLSGQSELWDKLKGKRYNAIRQRIDMCCVLPHMDCSQVNDYIRTHMQYAGTEADIFTDTAIETIYKASNGIMRMVNRICEKSLMYAFQQQKRLIDDHMVQFVLQHEMIAGGVSNV